VSEEFIGKPVSVLGNSKTIAIYHAGRLIESHQRVTDRARSKSTKRHHLKPWEQACDNPQWLSSMAGKIGPAVENVVLKVLLQGDGFINYRRIWGILSLNKKYKNDEINSACLEAIESGSFSSRAIEQIIVHAREELVDNHPSEIRPAGKFQRNIAEYRQLLFNLKPTGGNYEH
jgi:hypothetical protein